jgi:hypothetical protein
MADKAILITMPDGSVWRLAAQRIAADRAEHYARLDVERGDATDYDAAYAAELAATLEDEYLLLDWLRHNYNWADVQPHLTLVQPPAPTDYEAGWSESALRVAPVESEGA